MEKEDIKEEKPSEDSVAVIDKNSTINEASPADINEQDDDDVVLETVDGKPAALHKKKRPRGSRGRKNKKKGDKSDADPGVLTPEKAEKSHKKVDLNRSVQIVQEHSV